MRPQKFFFMTTLMLATVAFSWGFAPGVHAKSKKAVGAQPAQTTETTPKQPEKESLLKTERDKVNYAIGVNLIGNIKRQGVEIDLDLVMKGMKDAYFGRGAPPERRGTPEVPDVLSRPGEADAGEGEGRGR